MTLNTIHGHPVSVAFPGPSFEVDGVPLMRDGKQQVMIAPYAMQLLTCSIHIWDGTALPASSDTDYWTMELCRGFPKVVVATVTTKLTGGNPWLAWREREVDPATFTNAICNKGDIITLQFKKVGNPAPLVHGMVATLTVLPVKRTDILCVGDTHFGLGDTQPARLAAALADLNTLSGIDAIAQLGDQTHIADESEFADFTDWWGTLLPGIPRGLVAGNHDLIGCNASGTPDLVTTTEWAGIMGQADKDSWLDVGDDVRLVFLSPAADATTGQANVRRLTVDAATLAWAETAVDTERRCLLFFHAPLPETVGPLDGSAFSSYDERWRVHDEDGDLAVFLAAHCNIIAWVSSHTHSAVTQVDVVKTVTFGANTLAAISVPSAAFSNPVDPRIASALVSVYDDRLEVRYRDHGAAQWPSPTYSINPLH